MPTLETLLPLVLDLPETDRAKLALEVVDSLDREVHPDADEAWAEEIEARHRALQEGRLKTVPADEAIARVRERLRARSGV